MSIKTLRKRIAITATTALLAGALSVVATPASQAHNSVENGTNTATSVGQIAGIGTAAGQENNATTEVGSLFVATLTNTGTSAVGYANLTGTCDTVDDTLKSKGLLYKDSSSGIAQSATVLPGAVLSLYSCVATAAAFVATGGSLVAGGGIADTNTWSYNSTNTKAWSANINTAGGTGIAALWTAPTTVGTYTVSLYTGYYANGASEEIASSTTDTLPETLSGNITVTVAAASAGGAYSATNSLCQAVKNTVTYNASTSSNVDDTGTNTNGSDWSVDVFLRDAYGATLPTTGNLVATATNGALLAFGTAGTTPVAGSASTISSTGAGNNSTIRVSQATAGAPITTTVTVSWNGTVVCTKTVSIAGTVSALTVPAANIAVQDLGASAGNAFWFGDGTGRAGTFYVVATDSVGNRVPTPSTLGTFSADGATLGTTVTAITFDAASLATTSSSSSALSATVGRHSCAATAGTQKGVKIKFTLANGTVVTSAPFDLSCADDPATVSASFDKAKYTSGDVATLTVSFKDTKGNASNNITSLGASTIAVPGMTLVSTTGAADAVAKAGGKVTYTYTVGQTAGKYAAVVDFTGASTTFAQYATVQNPSYEITTGGDTTTNADVLKSIVALIASINKQIQALQKLILRR
jgi:filamentous hemagglutinin